MEKFLHRVLKIVAALSIQSLISHDDAMASQGGARSSWSSSWRKDPLETVLLAALLAGLAWAPFWLGGVEPIGWAVNGIWFPGLTIIYELSLLARGRAHPFALKNLAVPVGLFCLVLFWIAVQISTLFPSWIAHPIWGMASDDLGVQMNGAISVNPQASALALMRLLTDASVLWLAIQLGRDDHRATLMIEGVVAIVTVYSIYGLALSAFHGGGIPFFDVPDGGPFVRATFVNRNNFATFAGLGFIGAVALILRFYRHEIPEQTGLVAYRLSRLIEATGRRGWILIGAGVVILAALLGTVSRGGILATALGSLAVFVLSFARETGRSKQRIETILFVMIAVFAGFLLYGDRIVGRMAHVGLADPSRAAVYTIISHSLFDAPFLGFGYGTFADVFPMYRDQSISPAGVWDKAHNTYLEVLQGLGVIFGSALIGALALLAWKCLRAAVSRRRNATVPTVAASAALLVGAHAMVDFSVQIESVALTFMALLGAGVAQSQSSRHVTSD